MISIIVSTEAFEDIRDAVRFYNAQEKTLGHYFYSKLRTDIERLKFTGGTHRLFYKNLHRSLCKTFPYSIFYTFEGNIVRIFSVVDNRRDPRWIRNHLNRSSEH